MPESAGIVAIVYYVRTYSILCVFSDYSRRVGFFLTWIELLGFLISYCCRVSPVFAVAHVYTILKHRLNEVLIRSSFAVEIQDVFLISKIYWIFPTEQSTSVMDPFASIVLLALDMPSCAQIVSLFGLSERNFPAHEPRRIGKREIKKTSSWICLNRTAANITKFFKTRERVNNIIVRTAQMHQTYGIFYRLRKWSLDTIIVDGAQLVHLHVRYR